jgi:hypothetical protein
MLHFAAGQKVFDISMDCSALIFTVKLPHLSELQHSEDEGTTILRSMGNCLASEST